MFKKGPLKFSVRLSREWKYNRKIKKEWIGVFWSFSNSSWFILYNYERMWSIKLPFFYVEIFWNLLQTILIYN